MGASIADVLRCQIDEPAPRLTSIDARIPASLDDVLLRALSKAPEHRFPTVRLFPSAFSAAIGEMDRSTAARVLVRSTASSAGDPRSLDTLEGSTVIRTETPQGH